MANRLSRMVQRMEKSRESTLNEWEYMSKVLYNEVQAEVKKDKRFFRVSKGLYMFFLSFADMLLWGMSCLSDLIKEGKADFLPVNVKQAVVWNVTRGSEVFLIVIGILILIPIIFDIILIIMVRCVPTGKINVSNTVAVKSTLEKMQSIDCNLRRAESELWNVAEGGDWVELVEDYWDFKNWDGEIIGGRILCIILSILTGIMLCPVFLQTGDAGIFGLIILPVILCFLLYLILFIYQGIHHMISCIFLSSLKQTSIQIDILSGKYHDRGILSGEYYHLLTSQEQRKRETAISEEAKRKQEKR